LPAGTTFKLHIFFRRELPVPLVAKFDKALKAFLALGGIGLRVTRGLGAFTCAEVPFNESAIRPVLEKAGFKLDETRELRGDFASEIGSLVKGTRRDLGMKATAPSPFGSASPRQTSAIYFRPLANNRLAIFEAPHNRVLAPQSRRPITVGATPSKLTRAQPSAAPRRW
jgi:hypothetical protein